MTSRDPEPTYRYQFVTAPYRIDRPLSFRPENLDHCGKNAKISFRYLAECQENQKKASSPAPNFTRQMPPQEQTIQPAKNYTFSLLSKNDKPARRTEGIELTNHSALNQKYSQNLPKKPAFLDHSKRCHDRPEESKASKLSRHEHLKQKENERELSDLRRDHARLQEEVNGLTVENELLTVRLEDSKKRLQEHDANQGNIQRELKECHQKITCLEDQLKIMNIQNRTWTKEIEVLRNRLGKEVTSRQKLEKQSQVLQHCQEPQGSSCIQSVREESLSTLSSSFEEEYRKVAAFLGFQPFHANLTMEIENLKKKAEEGEKMGARIYELQRQRGKLLHVLKKEESELTKLCRHSNHLSIELQKHQQLVSDLNSELNLLHLSLLQQKLASKYSSPQ